MEVGKREITYLSLHCYHQNDSCIKMGSNESHFNVRDKATRQCSQSINFLKRKESRIGIEPRLLCLAYQPKVLPLGQTGSLLSECHFALRPQKRGRLLGTGTGREGDDRVKARPRIPPEKDRRDRGPPPEQWKC